MKIDNVYSKKRLEREKKKYKLYSGSEKQIVTKDFDNIRFNRFFMIDCIDKSQMDEFYSGLDSLFKKYSKVDLNELDLLYDHILMFERSVNTLKYQELGLIDFTKSELGDVIKCIKLYVYNLSGSTVGFVCDVHLSDSIKEEFNNFILNKHRFEYPNYIGEGIIINDFILEIKLKLYDVLKGYIPFICDKLEISPVSLNVYDISLKKLDPKDDIQRYIDLTYNTLKFSPAKLCDSNLKYSYFNYGNLDEVNNGLSLVVTNQNNIDCLDFSNLINLFTITISKYLLNDMMLMVGYEKKKLLGLLSKQNALKNDYKSLINLENKIILYRSLFDGLIIYKELIDEVNILFDNIDLNYNDRLKEYDDLINSYNIAMTVSNYRSAYIFTIMSLSIITLSFLMDLFLEFIFVK